MCKCDSRVILLIQFRESAHPLSPHERAGCFQAVFQAVSRPPLRYISHRFGRLLRFIWWQLLARRSLWLTICCQAVHIHCKTYTTSPMIPWGCSQSGRCGGQRLPVWIDWVVTGVSWYTAGGSARWSFVAFNLCSSYFVHYEKIKICVVRCTGRGGN